MPNSEGTKQFTALGKYGMVGVLLASMLLSGYAIFALQSISERTLIVISENTQAVGEMTGMLKTLQGSLSIRVK